MWKKRIPAYIIDMMIVTIIINIFGLVFPKWVELENKSQEELNNIFVRETDNGEVITDEAFNVIIDKSAITIQNNDKETIIYKGLEIMVLFGYFVILPLSMNGQTVGKRIFKIKVVGENDKLTYKNLIIRTLLITDLGVLAISCIFVYILPALPYFIFKDVLSISEFIILIISFVKVIRNEKHLGLHDILAKTEVKESI